MPKPSRNDPCPCGSGKKYKKCCAPKDDAAARSASSGPEPAGAVRAFATNLDPDKPGRRDTSGWSVERAFVPLPDVWRATGLGCAGIVCRRPDERLEAGFFMINLLENGLTGMFGKADMSAADLEAFLDARLVGAVPPFAEGPVELASRFAWGARALNEDRGGMFPPGQADRFFSLLPAPPGGPREWTADLLGAELTPPGLVSVVRDNPMPEDLPEGQEIMIVTEMTFDVGDPAAARAAVRKRRPEFEAEEPGKNCESFIWTRKYPAGHWSPLSRLGGRQTIGSVRIGDGGLVAEAKTLSMAARLAATLKELLGDRLRLRDTRWTGTRDMLSRKGREP